MPEISRDEQINKMCFIQTIEYHLTINLNKVLVYGITLNNLETNHYGK